VRMVFVVLSMLAWATVPATAQPAAEPKIWTVTASVGLALTSGNTDTSTFNAAYDLVYNPQTKNVVKSDGLMIRGTTQGELSADRLGINFRDEYKIGARAFVFGQNQYLRDEFKSIDYLLAPTGGIGYRLFDTTETKLGVDGGLGAVWEKNPGADVRASGAVTLGERLTQTLTSTTSLTQSFSGLWKTKEFEDALYIVGVGVAAAMSTRTQLKVELLDTFKNKPPLPTVQKNDVAVLMSIVYKM
jgi:putative salt-induced outer membrane protein YdiY